MDMIHKEFELVLDGVTHIMRPTFKALSHIEAELQTGIVALSKKLVDGAMTLEELATVIIHCIETETPAELVKEAIVHSGLAHVSHAVAVMFSHLFEGKKTTPIDVVQQKAP